MRTFHLVAMNPSVAVLTGTAVRTADMVRILSVEADRPEDAMAMGVARADSGGYRVLAVAEAGALLVGAEVANGVERVEDAFPLDAALSGSMPFHVDEEATFRRAEQSGDMNANRGDWDLPIQTVTSMGEDLRFERIGKSWGGAGFGFARGRTVNEDYVVGDGEDAVVLTVRRDATTLAASGRLRSAIPNPDAAREWFHSHGRSAAVAASALAAAVRHARGLDPDVVPASPSP